MASLKVVTTGLAACLLLLPAGGAASSAAAKPRSGGTVTIALVEPSSLNPFAQHSGPTPFSVFAAHTLAFADALEVMPDSTYRPRLLVAMPRVTRRPFTVTYTLRRDVRWSDGRPLTARDLVFTWQTFRRQPNLIWRAGYEDIQGARVRGRRTVTFRFKRPYAAYRALFRPVLPRHALAGEDVTAFWQNGLDNPKTGRPIGSGPFLLTSWQRGVRMVFERNPRYWGKPPYLRRIVVRLSSSDRAFAEALRRRDVDLATLVADAEVQAVVRTGRVRVRVVYPPGFDHLVFNLRPGTGGHPLLRRPFLRRAIAHALDRAALVRAVHRGAGNLLPAASRRRPLQSLLLYPGSRYYRPHWQPYRHDRRLAQRILRRNGCRTGSDGIFRCGGERLSFRLTAPNHLAVRVRVHDAVRAQLRRVGIEIRPDLVAPSVFSGRSGPLAGGAFDLALYGFGGSAEPDGSPIFGCDGAQNFSGYCDREVTRVLDAATVELERRRQGALINRALAEMAKDLPVLPLYQIPTYVTHARALRGFRPNPPRFAVTWSARRWWLAGR